MLRWSESWAFLISVGFRDPRGRPIQNFRNHAELIIHGHFRLGALISSREPLGKSRQSANGRSTRRGRVNNRLSA